MFADELNSVARENKKIGREKQSVADRITLAVQACIFFENILDASNADCASREKTFDITSALSKSI